MDEGSLKEEILSRANRKAEELIKGVEEEENRAIAQLDKEMAARMEKVLSQYKAQLKE
jgi:hypothetical protein